MRILFDEIKIKSGFVYSKQAGSIVGFCDMGDMNNELEDFKNRIENKEEDKSMSTYILTFMVRGVFTPLAFCACTCGNQFKSTVFHN